MKQTNQPICAFRRSERGSSCGPGQALGAPEGVFFVMNANPIEETDFVPRGLDDAAVMQLIARMESHSYAANDEARRLAAEDMDGEACAYQDGAAYAYNDCAKWLRDALRKQQGERPEQTEAGNQP